MFRKLLISFLIAALLLIFIDGSTGEDKARQAARITIFIVYNFTTDYIRVRANANPLFQIGREVWIWRHGWTSRDAHVGL